MLYKFPDNLKLKAVVVVSSKKGKVNLEYFDIDKEALKKNYWKQNDDNQKRKRLLLTIKKNITFLSKTSPQHNSSLHLISTATPTLLMEIIKILKESYYPS